MTRNRFTPAENELMTRFVLERVQSSTAPINMSAMWRDLVMIENINRTPEALHLRYVTALARKIQQNPQFSLDEKAHIMFSTRQPLDRVLLGELQKSADVLVLNEKDIIVKYQKGELVLSAEQRRLRKRVKIEEDELLILDSDIDFPMPIPFLTIKKEILEVKEEKEEVEDVEKIQNFSEKLEKSITLKKLLKFLQNLTNFLDSPHFSHLQQSIENALQNCKNRENPILSLRTVRLCLETMLLMSLPNSFNLGDVEMVDARILMKFVRATILGWKLPAIQDILERVEAAIRQMNEMKTPMNNLRVALEMVFTAATRNS